VPLRPTTGGLLRRHAIELLRHREIIEEVQRSGDERLAFRGVAGIVGPRRLGAWNGYPGGFFLRASSACVPLVVGVGQRSATVRFGIGRRCG
jgi:hypothetical protein